MKSSWIDVSVPLRSGMVHWPGDPAVRIQRIKELRRGDSSTLSHLSMGSHTGTHIDAPSHFLPKGATLDRLPWEALIGPARVITIRHPARVTVEGLQPARIRRGERILFKTRNSTRCWRTDKFQTRFVHLDSSAARFLSARKIKTVGIDYLSVGGYKKDGREVHRILLGAGIWIIEGLDLSRVVPGRYELLCLPLKIASGEGAPARALLKRY